MINKLGLPQTFTSKVIVSDYEGADDSQRERLQSPKFLKELKEIKNNGNKDVVIIRPDALSEDIYLHVTEKNKNDVKMASTILFPEENVNKVYSDMKESFKNRYTITIGKEDPVFDYLT